MTQELNLYIMSDSVGETGLRLAQAVAAQFPEFEAIMFAFRSSTRKKKFTVPLMKQRKKMHWPS